MISSCSYRQEGFCGKLVKSMYGTLDASAIWQRSYTELPIRAGFTKTKLGSPAFIMKVTVAFEFLCTEMTSWCLLMMLDKIP